MKKLLIGLLALTSTFAFALDCKTYEGRRNPKYYADLYNKEVKTIKSTFCKKDNQYGNCLNFSNKFVEGVIRIYNDHGTVELEVLEEGLQINTKVVEDHSYWKIYEQDFIFKNKEFIIVCTR